MIDQAAIKASIQSWATSALVDKTVIFANQGEVKPDKPYVTLNINSFKTAGYDDESQPDTNDLKTLKGPRVFVAEFQALGANAMSLLDILKTSVQKVATTELLDIDNIAFMSCTDINDITISQETKFEERAVLEITFAIGSSEQDAIDIVENVNIDYTVNDPSGNVVLNDTINI